MNQEVLFSKDILTFINQIDSLNQSLPLTNAVIMASSFLSKADFQSFVKERGDLIRGEIHYEISSSDISKFNRLRKRKESTELALKIIQRSFITSLVSQYDAFIGKIIRNLLTTIPEHLNLSEKQISFSQLLNFDNIESAKEYLIEKEVETVLRENHLQHFKYLESKLKIPYTKELAILPQFIEITERRNLFVHTDGRISSQYLNVCKKNGVSLDENISVGEELVVDKEYFRRSYRCIYELGVKLGIVTWRKMIPQEKETADKLLNHICYELLHEEEYELAIGLLNFALNMPKIATEQIRLMYIINLAQSYKWLGQNEKSKELLSNYDWSACSNVFKICVSIIKDNFDEASELMGKIGDELDKNDYHEWPIFKNFRKSEAFKSKYKDLFNEEFKEPKIQDSISGLNYLVDKMTETSEKMLKKEE